MVSVEELRLQILKTTKKVIIKAMGEVKLIEQNSSEEPTELLCLEEILDRLAKANRM